MQTEAADAVSAVKLLLIERCVIMQFLGVNIPVKNIPELDPGFIPLHLYNRAFLADAKKPVSIAFAIDTKQQYIML